MFKLCLSYLFIFSAALSHAAVDTDGFYKVITHSHPNFSIRYSSFYNTSDYLLNGACKDGTFQALGINVNQPFLIPRRRNFLVIDRGNSNFRFIDNFVFEETQYLQKTQQGTLIPSYSEVDFLWPTASNFIKHNAALFFSSVAAESSNCLAIVTYPIQRVKT
jgi:hypothetical protein